MEEKKNPRYPHRQQKGNHQNCPILPPFPSPRRVFLAHPCQSPFPTAAQAAALQLSQKQDLFPGFIPQNTRSRLGRDFPRVPTQPCTGRGKFYRLRAIFFPIPRFSLSLPLFFPFPPLLFFFPFLRFSSTFPIFSPIIFYPFPYFFPLLFIPFSSVIYPHTHYYFSPLIPLVFLFPNPTQAKQKTLGKNT